MLYNNRERQLIMKYNGKCGFKMTHEAAILVRRYNLMLIRREILRLFRII